MAAAHPVFGRLDLAPLPEFRQKMTALMGEQEFTRASCIGEVRIKDMQPLEDDIRRFTLAMQRNGGGVRGFMNAASPGLVTAFQPNQFYPTHEAYLADLIEAMRPEYEAIIAAGFDLQLDAPDLAMAAHTGFQGLSEAEFLKRAEQNVEALNAATQIGDDNLQRQERDHVPGQREDPDLATDDRQDDRALPGLVQRLQLFHRHGQAAHGAQPEGGEHTAGRRGLRQLQAVEHVMLDQLLVLAGNGAVEHAIEPL